MMLANPSGVHAELLGVQRLIGNLLHKLVRGTRIAVVVIVAEREIAELHGPSQCPSANSTRQGLTAGRLARGSRINFEKAADEIRLACAREAAFCRNAELRHVIVRKRDALVCTVDAVVGMNETEIDLGLGRQREVPHRREEVVGRARQGNRQVHIGDLVLDAARDSVGGVDEMASGYRIEIMFATEIAITEMETEVDIGGHRLADASKTRLDLFA